MMKEKRTMKKKVSFILLSLLLVVGAVIIKKENENESNRAWIGSVIEDKTIKQQLSDISDAHWAKNEIMTLVELGVIKGYPDGEFRSALKINRGQAANLFTEALKLPQMQSRTDFIDVRSQSIYKQGVMATIQAGIFIGKSNEKFGVMDGLTREQMATTLIRAFNFKDTGEKISFKDWNRISKPHRKNVEILAQHGIMTGKKDGTFDPKSIVDRATFAVVLYRSLVVTDKIAERNYIVTEGDTSKNFILNRQNVNFVRVTNKVNPLYIRSSEKITDNGKETRLYDTAKDAIYNYVIGANKAHLEITIRQLKNGDEFVFATLNNISSSNVEVDLFQKESNIQNYRFYRYNRFQIEKNLDNIFGYDASSTPTGLLRLANKDGRIRERMVGQVYRSQQLVKTYHNGGKSFMRNLISEREMISYTMLKEDLYIFYTLSAQGKDIVDTWYMDSKDRLFKTDDHMNNWMLESVQNYSKRNKWYTSTGPYNKMAVSTEPMPTSLQGFGRNLLLVKEDRALTLYKEQGDRYFENLVNNAFINLEIFKGNKDYWETEVTSTYLKGLYGIHAPFIDTRFNEQIALFYYHSGEMFKIPNYKEPLRRYANLLVSQEKAGNIIRVDDNSYYIADYFPIHQSVTTHSSMNHVLGGMNLLLIAYKEFGDNRYLQTATAIQSAISMQKDKWMRSNGDIWYRVNPKGQFAGEDYRHLTLEDLINSYRLWKDIDPTSLPVLEEMIVSKANYLSENRYGYTLKIKNGLEEIGMLQYLPKGELYTDALK